MRRLLNAIFTAVALISFLFCALAVIGWIRSYQTADYFEQAFSHFSALTFESNLGEIRFSIAWSPLPIDYHTHWAAAPAAAANPAGFATGRPVWSALGLGVDRGSDGLSHFVGVQLPYWILVLPLAVLPALRIFTWVRRPSHPLDA